MAKNAVTLVTTETISLRVSVPICNVGGTIADACAVENLEAPMAPLSGIPFMGPCIGPMIGGRVDLRADWGRILDFVCFVGPCFVFTLFMRETFILILLRKKAERLRKEKGD